MKCNCVAETVGGNVLYKHLRVRFTWTREYAPLSCVAPWLGGIVLFVIAGLNIALALITTCGLFSWYQLSSSSTPDHEVGRKQWKGGSVIGGIQTCQACVCVCVECRRPLAMQRALPGLKCSFVTLDYST